MITSNGKLVLGEGMLDSVAPLFWWVVATIILSLFVFYSFMAIKELREDRLVRRARLEWVTIERNDILSLQSDGNSKEAEGSYLFSSTDQLSSENGGFYRYAITTEQGIQIKQTNQTFPDIPTSSIFIHETDASKPYYAYQEVTYTDSRIKRKTGEKRLIFFVPEGTVQNLFCVK